MHEEKKNDRLRWLSHNDLKFRIRKLDEDISVIWVSKQGADIVFSLMFYDFLDRCSDNLNIEIDSAWYQWKGFKVKNNEVDFLIGEVISFIEEWGVEASNSENRLSEEEWYSL